MLRVATHEAKMNLSLLISMVLKGERVVILRGGQPVAILVSVKPGAESSRRPAVGTRTTSNVTLAPSAFAPLRVDELADWGA